MDKTLFESLEKSANEMVDYVRTGKPSKEMIVHQVNVPDNVDVKAIREQLKMSQGIFAKTFGFSVSTLRKWEQGERTPESSARVLLNTIAYNPNAVIEANRDCH
ncbi:putative transcriptional regulator [Aquimarina sp. MAR_2010_214]|uniref:helix-turn-helix domain-containing protein n=1 Tax=Aquimarina sp. MAR_2010_214 TaxID=1250026 RepID=UPI000CC14185|nr:helix-turn-helix domain-containing protein [Aquimarina sp. MAR_2010_214]PKV50851.1 putative transcriptional regulator [Aquimarina sp. MAR_2010_214]